jgi:hypothetical protein
METLAQFTDRMSKVEKETEFYVGPSYKGHSRAIFYFERQVVYLESSGYTNYDKVNIPVAGKALLMTLNEPKDHWWTDYMSFGKMRARKIAKHYKAKIREAPYAEVENKWFYYVFQTFEDLMQFVYDRFTGKFEELWGKEPQPYIQCYGDQTPVDMNPQYDFEKID